MELIALLIVIIALALVVLIARKKGVTPQSQTYSYTVKQAFLSPAERSFFSVLTQAVADKGVVLTKIRMADVLTPKKPMSRSLWQTTFNRISAKHFDFLVCDPASLEPVLAVELDDASHQNKKTVARDAIKDSASQSAGFPLLRVRARKSYALNELRTSLSTYIPGLIESADEEAIIVRAELEKDNTGPAGLPLCPVCNSVMKRRVSKRGKHGGTAFWGCIRFPQCKGVRLEGD